MRRWNGDSNNKSLGKKKYKDHEKVMKQSTNANMMKVKWLHESFGTNWRMTEMQAVIGRIFKK